MDCTYVAPFPSYYDTQSALHFNLNKINDNEETQIMKHFTD